MNEIQELREYLLKKYQEWYENPNEDHHSKRSEGCVTIDFPGFFTHGYTVSVYSYVFGPSRQHDFTGETLQEAIDKAFKEVKGWFDE
jgi:hypothetical protein